MKLITFSLWGQDPKYLVGALKNAELAQEIYPGWTCRYYIGASVPFSITYQLEAMSNVQVVRKPDLGDWRGMFWRFEPASEDGVEVMISRDTDSRLNEREKEAVDEWLMSNKGFHVMRDHPYHRYPVLGGMWGIKKGVLPQMKDLINSFSQQDEYGTDYKFFAEKVLPLVDIENTLIHDEFFGGIPFPTSRKQYEFVGQVFDENEKTVQEHVDALLNSLK
jgi:protein O-GlcNAc transferase